MFQYLGVALLVLNVVTFFIYGLDKLKASEQQWRISEKTLLLLVAFGGVVGGWIGMRYWRHKSRKQSFQIRFALASLVCVLWVGGLWHLTGG